MRQVLTVLLGCLIFLSWPPKVMKAAEVPGTGSHNSCRSTSGAACFRKPVINELISKHADRAGIDPALVRAVIHQESGFDPQAVSPKGAIGLMQLMPGTALLMGVSDPFDTEQNIVGGIKYLLHCLQRFDGNLTKALAAYNAGPLNVEKYDGCPPFAETRNYVAQVMQAYTGQAALVAGGLGRFPSPPTRLSPSALAVLKELYPYRYTSAKQIIAEHSVKPVPGKRSTMSPTAMAVLKELYPYRHRNSEGSVVHRPGKTKKNRAMSPDRTFARMTL